jgi:hypothetical protein
MCTVHAGWLVACGLQRHSTNSSYKLPIICLAPFISTCTGPTSCLCACRLPWLATAQHSTSICTDTSTLYTSSQSSALSPSAVASALAPPPPAVAVHAGWLVACSRATTQHTNFRWAGQDTDCNYTSSQSSALLPSATSAVALPPAAAASEAVDVLPGCCTVMRGAPPAVDANSCSLLNRSSNSPG